MLEACRGNLVSKNTMLLHCDVSDGLPFLSSCFDYVYSVRVLKYTKDIRAAIAEAYRVLKPGGKFLMTMPNPFSDQHF